MFEGSDLYTEILAKSSLETDSSASATDILQTSRHSSPISTFVIYTSTNLNSFASASPPVPTGTTTTALRQEDAQVLENEFADGGTIFSVHSPDEAVAWVEAHCDHPLLKSIRSHSLGGPIAAILSPDEPALAIFGSILDSGVLEVAKLVSDLSKFTVMIRPLTDDPVPEWRRAADIGRSVGPPRQALDLEDINEVTVNARMAMTLQVVVQIPQPVRVTRIT
ncbi:hypothetical protein B0H10DRAFT_2048679 [Mycena sp. CBHHK59/15]|nr:hypothetical protein B0H10DRAFT_2048679 [Mycena sp. CBHHK59/15]